ncbi:high mobility group B protein 15-like [Glycine soja]|uniref:High mobility group B protein 15 n=1 Tax=Glycine soja TaxID=3848 RepID=A0A445IUH7_GLYSO|nr:high mobility group B protein 15-like [Glycine soja]KHN37294.1 High mobility group B protein 15 [Glycine soja]RZB89741.1 High mobility group B protein 15 [Glycine soja]
MATSSSADSTVIGVIDQKFEGGYVVTVTMGSEQLNGVLYYAQEDSVLLPAPSHNNNNAAAASLQKKKRRRSKSEIKRRNPALPKPKKTGYNFFFAEEHARLKPYHQGKETDIGRMIGENWSKLTESEKMVYQEMSNKDKERYLKEMEEYVEKLKADQVIVDAVPLRQWPPQQDTDIQMEEAEAGEGSFDMNAMSLMDSEERFSY